MAFSDWRFYSQGAMTSFLNFGNPIAGSSSLSIFSSDSSSTANAAAVAHLRPGFPLGNIRGRIRSLARVDRAVTSTFDDAGPGVYFMSNNLDITGTSSNYYWAGVHVDNNLSLVIAKASNTALAELNWSTATGVGSVLERTGVTSVLEGDVIPFQVEWEADLVNYGGTRIILSMGNLNDTGFNSLAVQLDLVDSVSPYVTSIAEGIGYANRLEGFSQPKGTGFTYDKTGVFNLV